ncbi:hypothetical protein V6Z11_A07G047000 [Gossypium hirsutum]
MNIVSSRFIFFSGLEEEFMPSKPIILHVITHLQVWYWWGISKITNSSVSIYDSLVRLLVFKHFMLNDSFLLLLP